MPRSSSRARSVLAPVASRTQTRARSAASTSTSRSSRSTSSTSTSARNMRHTREDDLFDDDIRNASMLTDGYDDHDGEIGLGRRPQGDTHHHNADVASRNAPRSTRPRRKAEHNVIERRYRTNINDRILELRRFVPALNSAHSRDPRGSRKHHTGSGNVNSGDSDAAPEICDGISAARKLSKASILRKSTEYIVHLKTTNVVLDREARLLRRFVVAVASGVGKECIANGSTLNGATFLAQLDDELRALEARVCAEYRLDGFHTSPLAAINTRRASSGCHDTLISQSATNDKTHIMSCNNVNNIHDAQTVSSASTGLSPDLTRVDDSCLDANHVTRVTRATCGAWTPSSNGATINDSTATSLEPTPPPQLTLQPLAGCATTTATAGADDMTKAAVNAAAHSLRPSPNFAASGASTSSSSASSSASSSSSGISPQMTLLGVPYSTTVDAQSMLPPSSASTTTNTVPIANLAVPIANLTGHQSYPSSTQHSRTPSFSFGGNHPQFLGSTTSTTTTLQNQNNNHILALTDLDQVLNLTSTNVFSSLTIPTQYQQQQQPQQGHLRKIDSRYDQHLPQASQQPPPPQQQQQQQQQNGSDNTLLGNVPVTLPTSTNGSMTFHNPLFSDSIIAAIHNSNQQQQQQQQQQQGNTPFGFQNDAIANAAAFGLADPTLMMLQDNQTEFTCGQFNTQLSVQQQQQQTALNARSLSSLQFLSNGSSMSSLYDSTASMDNYVPRKEVQEHPHAVRLFSVMFFAAFLLHTPKSFLPSPETFVKSSSNDSKMKIFEILNVLLGGGSNSPTVDFAVGLLRLAALAWCLLYFINGIKKSIKGASPGLREAKAALQALTILRSVSPSFDINQKQHESGIVSSIRNKSNTNNSNNSIRGNIKNSTLENSDSYDDDEFELSSSFDTDWDDDDDYEDNLNDSPVKNVIEEGMKLSGQKNSLSFDAICQQLTGLGIHVPKAVFGGSIEASMRLSSGSHLSGTRLLLDALFGSSPDMFRELVGLSVIDRISNVYEKVKSFTLTRNGGPEAFNACVAILWSYLLELDIVDEDMHTSMSDSTTTIRKPTYNVFVRKLLLAVRMFRLLRKAGPAIDHRIVPMIGVLIAIELRLAAASLLNDDKNKVETSLTISKLASFINSKASLIWRDSMDAATLCLNNDSNDSLSMSDNRYIQTGKRLLKTRRLRDVDGLYLLDKFFDSNDWIRKHYSSPPKFGSAVESIISQYNSFALEQTLTVENAALALDDAL